ncbi:hypothetical protein PENTCL1PPCAC_23218 [Pristionchus entomophagus]|uniref:WD40 domain-containing protein n=1 Tax=Pristionchus entomophagus TaxID=358040 RepID=A0AAV5U3Q6_9BILA|nr:hypothetical protein PENTCL1PPCAC_23218 [Pristionchus entomophagus]
MASSTGSEVIGVMPMDDLPSTSTKDEEEKEMDEQAQFEMLHAMERLLEGRKFGRAAAALRREINERSLVPSRIDFEGTEHPQNYRQFLTSLSNLPSTSKVTGDSLPDMISRLSSLSDRSVAPPVKGLKLRLITNRRSAIQRTNEVLIPPHRPILIHGRRGHTQVFKSKHSPIELLRSRELGSRVPPSLLPGERSIELIERHFRILGHLANVFCVAFDRTENYLITGADDNLVKVWNVNQALLKFTYRGHSAEIADLSVSYCNQLVASGSNDKTIRVWRLQNGETLQVFRHHTASVTSVKFLPYTGNALMRYLVTTGNDCIVNIYMFNEETLEFPAQNGLVYHKYERDQPGAKMVSICNSAGGHVLAIGETHGVIRVYRMHENGEIEKMNDITAHTDRVDSLMWAHSGLRFCSGSKDGTARIWRFECGEWQQTVLSLSPEELFKICGLNAAQNNPNSKNKYKVSMVCWTLDDSRIITTGSEHSFRVWDTNGTQLLKLSLHTDDAFHLCAHPIHSHLILSSGHDGIVAMWDVVRGVIVHKWNNTVEQGEQAAVFDLSLTKDGTRFAIVDNKGHVSMYGLGTNKKKFPRQQFFDTDYSPITLDDRGWAMDVTTELAPHLMPPPRLIDTLLVEYGPEIQALVPGRDQGVVAEEDLVCPWITRNIVPKLSHNEMETWAEKKLILARIESEEYEREKARERPVPVVTPIVPFTKRRNVRASRPTNFLAAFAAENALAQARRSEIRRDRVIEANAMAMFRRGVSLRYIGVQPEDGEEQEGDQARLIDYEEEEVEEETDTSDTDYESDGERRERRERERERQREREREREREGTTSRPRRREREREVEEMEMDESSQHSRSERRRRRRGEEDEFGNDLSIDMYDPLPSTSTGRSRRGRREETHDISETPQRGERSNGRARRVRRSAEIQDPDHDLEIEPEMDTVVREERRGGGRQPSVKDRWKFSFPDWMREVKRKRFPYVAQIGDNVVYFRQGHEVYLNTVDTAELYYVDMKMRPKSDIGMEEFAVVEDVKYILKPYRLTQLKLAKTDSEGRKTGGTWIVKHHDMESVPDFIILRAFYEEGLAMSLDVGDEIEAAIDDQWWSGTVENMNKNESYPNAHWQSVGVRWASGDDDALSVWDMRKNRTGRGSGAPVSEEEVTTMGSVPYSEGDWPEGDENGEAIRRRIKRAILELARCETIQVFGTPVPIDEYTEYPTKVALSNGYPDHLR